METLNLTELFPCEIKQIWAKIVENQDVELDS